VPRKRNQILGQFSAKTIEMLESPAYQALSLSARKVLERLEIEFAGHGGTENGNLPCTYEDFQTFNIDRHSIAPAIREAEALGFIKVKRGRAGNGEFRSPNIFTLTYRDINKMDQTNEWKRIKSYRDAKRIGREARNESDENKLKKQKTSGGNPH
jgi:hypothetical protein